MGKPVLKIMRLRPGARLPLRASPGATGFDLFACIDGEGSVGLGLSPKLIGTGLAIEVPKGFDVQIRPRSGLSAKGVGVPLGTIDSDYRGELMVTMYLVDPGCAYEVKHGERIAQIVVGRLAELPVVEVDDLTTTARGARGHGSTGK